MPEQLGRMDIASGVSESKTLLEQLQRSAVVVGQLAGEVGPGVCVATDGPQTGLRQEAEALRQMGAQLQMLLKSWALIAELSNRMLNLPLNALEEGLRTALTVLGEHSGVQRCYMFLFTEDGRAIADAYEWCAPGVKAHDLASFRGVSVEAFPWSMKQWLAGQTIIVTDPRALPPEASPERGSCEAMEITTYVNAPMFLGGQLIGWLGYDAVGVHREWTQEELRLMAMASDVLVNALARKRRDELLFREKEMHQRAESMGILAAGLAHEINNPLSFTSGNLSFLKESLPRNPREYTPDLAAECQDVLADALEGTARIRRIVADLKSFSSADAAELGAVDLKSLVDSTLRMASNQLRHRAEVVRAYGDIPLVRGTVTKLGQVLLNLILNAAQAIPEGHVSRNRITVSMESTEETVKVTIADTGCGILEEVLPRIFDPFFTTRRVGEGMGMGLAISRNIISSFGGTISVRSRVGVGTTVEVVLPRAERPQEKGVEEVPARVTAGRRVLVVDDESRVLELLKRTLRGHELVLASNGREALERLEADPRFDLILCDLMMPELTGMDVYRYVSERHPELKERIVFITGGAFTPDTKRFLQEVSNPVVTKPFELNSIRSLVSGTGERPVN
jgi:two-component system, NtrC family, sensor kinase